VGKNKHYEERVRKMEMSLEAEKLKSQESDK